MQYRLDMTLKSADGALLRVLGMTERRGFSPCKIQGERVAGDAGRWHVQLIVDGSRPAETLQRQLEKVYDCESVSITPLDPMEAAA